LLRAGIDGSGDGCDTPVAGRNLPRSWSSSCDRGCPAGKLPARAHRGKPVRGRRCRATVSSRSALPAWRSQVARPSSRPVPFA